MDYEKAYKEALERARMINNGEDVDVEAGTTTCEYIFPELKESEDERIRQYLITYFSDIDDCASNLKGKDVVAWLEKQKEIYTEDFGEFINELSKQFPEVSFAKLSRIAVRVKKWLKKQDKQKVPVVDFKAKDWYVSKVDGKIHNIYNSVDRIEPKFKVGDWVVNNISKDVFLIKSINNGYCTLEDIKGNIISPCLPPCESESHLWTIQDANDGDALAVKGAPFIYKKHDKDYVYLYCGVNLSNEFVEAKKIDSWNNNNKVYPATKEQRDILFAKMRKAGYMWDVEKKELEKIHVIDEGKAEMDYCFTKMMNGEKVSSAWSKEDEDYYDAIIAKLEVTQDDAALTDNQMKFLKSIKQRYTWKPSNEQMEVLLSEVNSWKKGCPKQIVLESLYNDLKKLK